MIAGETRLKNMVWRDCSTNFTDGKPTWNSGNQESHENEGGQIERTTKFGQDEGLSRRGRSLRDPGSGTTSRHRRHFRDSPVAASCAPTKQSSLGSALES